MRLFVTATLLAVVLVEVFALQYPSKLELNGELSEVLHNSQSLLESHIMSNKHMGDVRCANFGSWWKNIFFPVSDKSTAELNNVTLSTTSDLNLESVKPNLDEMNIEVNVSFSSLKVQGRFKITTITFFNLLPIVISGQFSLNLTDMKATGKVGLKLEGDTLSTTNPDINYQPENKSLTLESPKDAGAQASTQKFEEMLKKKIDEEVKNLLNEQLKKELDKLLGDESIMKLIQDKKMRDDYRSHVQNQSSNVNAMVDNLLNHVRDYATNNSMQEIPIPPFKSSFSKEVFFVTWIGEFSVSDGYLKNLSTIQRTGDVSYSFDTDGTLVVLCSFMIADLQMGYKHYSAKFMNVGPTGSLKVDVGSHSLSLKITVDLKDGFSVKANEVRVEYIHDVEIHITGLGLLNWLTSKIATWIVGVFKGDIVDKISSLIKTSLNSYSSNVTPNLFNKSSTHQILSLNNYIKGISYSAYSDV